MTIGERIRQRRIELGLTQEELAKKLGNKSRASVCTVEKDKEDLTTTRIRQYAEALDVSPSYLMGWDDETPDAVDAYNNMKDRSTMMYEAYKQADDRTKALVDMALGLIRPDAVLPHSPEDNAQ